MTPWPSCLRAYQLKGGITGIVIIDPNYSINRSSGVHWWDTWGSYYSHLLTIPPSCTFDYHLRPVLPCSGLDIPWLFSPNIWHPPCFKLDNNPDMITQAKACPKTPTQPSTQPPLPSSRLQNTQPSTTPQKFNCSRPTCPSLHQALAKIVDVVAPSKSAEVTRTNHPWEHLHRRKLWEDEQPPIEPRLKNSTSTGIVWGWQNCSILLTSFANNHNTTSTSGNILHPIIHSSHHKPTRIAKPNLQHTINRTTMPQSITDNSRQLHK
jgi:hypothetical protein